MGNTKLVPVLDVSGNFIYASDGVSKIYVWDDLIVCSPPTEDDSGVCFPASPSTEDQ